jgi:hypothetical protein
MGSRLNSSPEGTSPVARSSPRGWTTESIVEFGIAEPKQNQLTRSVDRATFCVRSEFSLYPVRCRNLVYMGELDC